jgi:Flp pilus assembly protein TadD
MYSEGIAELQKAIGFSGGSRTFRSNLAYAYAISGRRSEALDILNDLKAVEYRLFKMRPRLP